MTSDPEKDRVKDKWQMICMSNKPVQSECDLCRDKQKKSVIGVYFSLHVRNDELNGEVWLCEEHLTQSVRRFYTDGLKKILKEFGRIIWSEEEDEWIQKAINKISDD
jgi:hypothetical protein